MLRYLTAVGRRVHGAGVCFVLNNASGFAQTAGVVDVHEGGKRSSGDLLGRSHNLLQGLSFCSSAVTTPLCDGTAEDTLNRPSVERCQDGGGEMGFPQLLQKLEMLLSFLCGV